MKIAMTGGSGFVGWHLARALVAEGHDVVVARGADHLRSLFRSASDLMM